MFRYQRILVDVSNFYTYLIMYGYIYITFFPADIFKKRGECYYIGQHRGDYDPTYIGSGKIVLSWLKSLCRRGFLTTYRGVGRLLLEDQIKYRIKNIVLCYADSKDELDVLERYFVDPHLGLSECLNLIGGGWSLPFKEKWTPEALANYEESLKTRAEKINKYKWFTNGLVNVRRIVCPEGFYIGRIRRSKKENPMKGNHRFNNGIINVVCGECPEGFVPGILFHKDRDISMYAVNSGKHWFNNGEINILSEVQPEGFVPGTLKRNLTENQRIEMRERMNRNRKNMNYFSVSDNLRGRHWYNNGKINIRTYECPEGFVPGCLHK